METQQVEKNIQIAERVPPGDKWKLLNGSNTVYNSLTETLEAYYQSSTTKPQAFRLEPLNSKLYVVTTQEVEIPVEAPKKFNMYGDW